MPNNLNSGSMFNPHSVGARPYEEMANESQYNIDETNESFSERKN